MSWGYAFVENSVIGGDFRTIIDTTTPTVFVDIYISFGGTNIPSREKFDMVFKRVNKL